MAATFRDAERFSPALAAAEFIEVAGVRTHAASRRFDWIIEIDAVHDQKELKPQR
jgi:hypothetical protein